MCPVYILLICVVALYVSVTDFLAVDVYMYPNRSKSKLYIHVCYGLSWLDYGIFGICKVTCN